MHVRPCVRAVSGSPRPKPGSSSPYYAQRGPLETNEPGVSGPILHPRTLKDRIYRDNSFRSRSPFETRRHVVIPPSVTGVIHLAPTSSTYPAGEMDARIEAEGQNVKDFLNTAPRAARSTPCS